MRIPRHRSDNVDFVYLKRGKDSQQRMKISPTRMDVILVKMLENKNEAVEESASLNPSCLNPSYPCVMHEGSPKKPACHAYLLIKTENRFFTVEKDIDRTLVQSSEIAEDVDEKKRDFMVHILSELAAGKGTVADLLHFILSEEKGCRYNYFTNNCQHLASKGFKHFNSEGKGFRIYLYLSYMFNKIWQNPQTSKQEVRTGNVISRLTG